MTEDELLPDDAERCRAIRPSITGGERCAGHRLHTGHHNASVIARGPEWGHDTIRDCPDCGAAPGRPHEAGCDIERCSWCGLQWIGCGHSRTRKHDPRFARWTGLYPGSAEARALGIDLNEFHMRGLYEVYFVKPR